MLSGVIKYQSDGSDDMGVFNLFENSSEGNNSSTDNDMEKIDDGTLIDNVASKKEGNQNFVRKF